MAWARCPAWRYRIRVTITSSPSISVILTAIVVLPGGAGRAYLPATRSFLSFGISLNTTLSTYPNSSIVLCARVHARARDERVNRLHGIPGLFCLDTGRADYLCPFLGIADDELTELSRRVWKRLRAQIGKSGLEFGIGKPGIDLIVELVDDFRRRVPWRAYALPADPLVARHEFATGGRSGNSGVRVALVTANARTLPALICSIQVTTEPNMT